MGVYIKGFDFPKACWFCDFCRAYNEPNHGYFCCALDADLDKTTEIIQTQRDKHFFLKKTNAERIRSMSDEELAELLCSGTCKYCHSYNKDCDILEWLRKEADEKTIRKTEENADTFQQS